MMRKRKWLRWILVLAIAVSVANVAFSRFLRTTAARRYLIAHLEASFGRPVEVGRFNFSLLDGARLEANSITIAEDPSFSHEYFLRADTLTAGLRWTALLSGHFEFGTLSLSRPSLNLVRDALGRWNIEHWLPPAASHTGIVVPVPPSSVPTARLYRIDINSGRINFKQGDDKSPLALIEVSGRLDQDSAGRWALDLQAQPMRAGVELQEIGTLRLRGSIAGTSARLQPAELNLTWSNASLADALRLSRESDYGLRGELSLDLQARVIPSGSLPQDVSGPGGGQWSISGVARLTKLHGWRLPGRDSDPAANLTFDAAWRLGAAQTQIRKLLIETPNSHLQGTGELDWAHGVRPELHLSSSEVGFSDVLSWYRALRPDVPENLSAVGTLGVDATLGGWPLRVERGAFASAGGRLAGPSLPSPLKIGAINASLTAGGLDFTPTEISFSPATTAGTKDSASAGNLPADSFTVRGTISPNGSAIFQGPLDWSFSVEGGTLRVENWLRLSQVLAQPVNSGWAAVGGLAVKLRGARKAESPTAIWLGTMDFRKLDVSLAYLNQPLRLSAAHIEFTQAQRTITLTAAEAFGATWRGNIARKNTQGSWSFDLTADRLDAAELDRWLGPRERPGLLARVADLGKPPADTSERDASIARITARGRLRVPEIFLAPLHFEQFDGEVGLAGRTITVHEAQAKFFGGKVSGSLEARLLADPSYQFQVHFDRVDLAALGRATASLSNRISGVASATLDLSAHGVGRENMVRSIQGKGMLDARNAQIRGLNLPSLITAGQDDSSSGRFTSAQGNFAIARGGIETSDFFLENSQGRFQVDGRIDFSHALNLRVHTSPVRDATRLAGAPQATLILGGTVEAPDLALPAAPAKPAARAR